MTNDNNRPYNHRLIGGFGRGTSSVSIYRDIDWDDYIVVPSDKGLDAAYHTDDKADAFSTARAMLDSMRPSAGCDYCEVGSPCCDAHTGAPWLVAGAKGFNGN